MAYLSLLIASVVSATIATAVLTRRFLEAGKDANWLRYLESVLRTHFATLAASFVGLCAVVVSYQQVGVADKQVQISERESLRAQEERAAQRLESRDQRLRLQEEQNRDWRLKSLTFVTEHRSEIFGGDSAQRENIKKVILATFPPEIMSPLFQSLIAQSASRSARQTWQDAARRVPAVLSTVSITLTTLTDPPEAWNPLVSVDLFCNGDTSFSIDTPFSIDLTRARNARVGIPFGPHTFSASRQPAKDAVLRSCRVRLKLTEMTTYYSQAHSLSLVWTFLFRGQLGFSDGSTTVIGPQTVNLTFDRDAVLLDIKPR